MTEGRISLQKYAMRLGTMMGIFWIFKFILFPLGFKFPFLLFFFSILTLLVPFMGYYYVRMFRDKVMGGIISFAQAWVFTIFMYIFAALLVAVAHYIYFQFIDHGFILNTYTDMLQEIKNMNMPNIETSIHQLEEGLTLVRALAPIEITIQLISQNIIICSFIALPTALAVARSKPKYL